MNERDELRVIETLRAYTGGLIVTEQDILNANDRLRSSLKPPSPRRRPLLIAVAAVFVLIIGVVAFQAINADEKSAPPPADQRAAADALEAALQADAYSYDFSQDEFVAGRRPTAQDLVGVWLLRTPYVASLLVNGSLGWTHDSVRTHDVGTSTLVGRRWTRTFDDSCGTGRLPWKASIAGDGSLHLLFAGSTNVCSPADDLEVWDRLAPGPSPVLDYVRQTSDDIEWVAPTDSELSGLYVNTETGYVLDVASNGGYIYVETVTGPEFTPSDEGTLTLTPGDDTVAGTCGAGNFSATLQFGKTESVPGLLDVHDVMRIADAGDTCSPGIGAGGVWLKVSYAG
jgi:hypothetical protein